VTSAIQLQSLRSSGIPVEKSLAEIMDVLSQLSAKIDQNAVMVDWIRKQLPANQVFGISQTPFASDIFEIETGPIAGEYGAPTRYVIKASDPGLRRIPAPFMKPTSHKPADDDKKKDKK
jgi:hypothetical protein